MPEHMRATAMPQLVPPTEFNLYDEKVNRDWAVYLAKLAEKSEKFHVLPHRKGPSKIEDVGTNNGYLFRYDHERGRIDYFVKFVNRNMTIQHRKHKVAMQALLWIDRKSPRYDYELAREAFYHIMLEKSGIVITDIQQTDKGQSFWLHRVNEVLDEDEPGLHAYLWDRRTHNEKMIRITHDNRDMLVEAWDWHQSGQLSRLIISKHPIE